jgi:predicted Rossmann fold nucleotide-binding protein DprA/Smf involved in DNA uptake
MKTKKELRASQRVPEIPEEAHLIKKARAIEKLLLSKPLCSLDIAMQLGFSVDDVYLALRDLELKEKIARGCGRWHLK